MKKIKSKKSAKATAVAAERRRKERRKKGAVNLIYQRLVARNILPDRRKGDRREA